MNIGENFQVQYISDTSSSTWLIVILSCVILSIIFYLFPIEQYCFSKKSRKTIQRHGHLWHESIPSNPKSCHECNRLLIPAHDKICECDYCGSFVHEHCISKSKFHCKQLTSSKPNIKHLWLDGNIDIGTTCCICHEEITSFVNLSGKRCVWCQRVVHEGCQSELDEICDFGNNKEYIISPSYVQSIYTKEESKPIHEITSQSVYHLLPEHQNTLSQPSLLQRSLSERIPSSNESSEGLRRRLSSNTSEDDCFLLTSSPPPNLVEYRIRGSSDDTKQVDSIEETDKTISWSSIFEELKKGFSSFIDYLKQIQNHPEIQQYFQRRKTADHQPWKLSIPLSLTPILVFINPRSGGLYGSQLLPRFRRILHPIQVVDLQEKNPQEVLRNYVGVANLRILVCGGTVGWVLNMIEKEHWKHCPAVAILPLGTGNDLSRSLHWGSGFSNDISAEAMLKRVGDAHSRNNELNNEEIVTLLDRWTLQIESKYRKQITNRIFNCYFSLGADAAITLRFHTMRESNPSLFNSQLGNKLMYAAVGGGEGIKPTYPILSQSITLKIDGVEYSVEDAVSVVCLNIPYYAGGGLPLGPNSDYFCSSDGVLEVIGFRNILHVATTRAGLSKAFIIGRGKHVQIEVHSECPLQVDGEPWMEKESTIDILYHGQAPMLTHSETTLQEALGVMADSLEWAKATNVIDTEQYQTIINEYRKRMRAVSNA